MHTRLEITLLISVLLLSPGLVQAQSVYQWIDEHGQTHYSDIAPPSTSARELDLNHSTLSTIGGSGLREEEKNLLERYAEEAQQRREQAASSSPPVVIVTPPPEPQPQPIESERYIVTTPIWQRWAQQRYNRSSVHFSLQIGGAKHHQPQRPQRPHRPHRPPKPEHPIEPPPAAEKPTRPSHRRGTTPQPAVRRAFQ